MAQNTDLNVSPYYDDYDETKDFHRILFRPSNAIQARELTQLQTILQNQVERFGNHVFDEGALVMGGTITVNKLYNAIKVKDLNPNTSGTTAAENYRGAAEGKYYQGKTSEVVGKVVNSAAKTTDGDALTLFVNYLNTGNPSGTTVYTTFIDNEEIEEVALSANGTYSNANNSNNEFQCIANTSGTNATSSDGDAAAVGSAATIRAGIFYTRGFFVRCDEQTILLDKYLNTPTYKIGLVITESLQSSTDDTSLLDNATGTSNENAPGANRLKIVLTLAKKAVTGTQDIDNFLELSRVEAGIITKQTNVTAYNTLERTLARRTFDESGDYVIKPFHLELREHLDTGLNNGFYLSTASTPGDETQLVGVVSPGKGYVKGFEIDKPSQSLINIGKARTTEETGAIAVPFEIGNYYNVTNAFGQPEFGTSDANVAPYGIIDLYSAKKSGTVSDVTVTLASGTLADGIYTEVPSATNGSGTGMVVQYTIASGATTAVTILDGGTGYAVGNTITFTDVGTTSNSLVLTIATLTQANNAGNGSLIGKARVRFYQCTSSTIVSGIHTPASIFRLYLFDIRMFTKLTTQATMANYKLTAGQRIVGASSGAKATVAVTVTSGTTLWVMDVEGSFTTNEQVRAEWDTSTAITANQLHTTTAPRAYSSDRVRSVYQASRTSGSANFTADMVLTDSQMTITGSLRTGQVSTGVTLYTVQGVNSTFTQELKEGDVIFPTTLLVDSRVVASVDSDTKLTLTAPQNGDVYGKFIRQRAQIQEQEKTVAIGPTPKDFVSSITPNTIQLRKQATAALSSGTGSVSGVGGETLASDPTSETDDYLITIMEAEGSETLPGDNYEGSTISMTQHDDIIEPSTSVAGDIAFDGTNATSLGGSATDQLKVVYTVTKDVSGQNAAKTLRRSRGVKVTTASATAPTSSASAEVYGTNYNDEIISLGVPDVYDVRAIYEANDAGGARPPKLTLASGFAGNPGDKITGGTSGAQGKIIQVSSTTVYFYYITGDIDFVVGETVTNKTSTDTTSNSRVIAANGVTVVSKDITSNYMLDDGQRDGYYGLASIKRKAGLPSPSNEILIIFDFFTAAAGNFFTINSYSDLNFTNVPNYIPNITDPTGLEPDGVIELGDAVDFRSYVGRLENGQSPYTTLDPSAVLNPVSAVDVSSITVQPLAYTSSKFHATSASDVTGTGAVTFDLPKTGQSLLTTALSHYLSRIDKISLSSDGQFILTVGQAADHPAAPSAPANSILLHTLYIPPYTKDIGTVSAQAFDHKRFTMKDIGRIQGRVKNLERITSLNSLEQEANLHQIQDADGLDRFKSGFVTDNFRGHKTGDVSHPDYKIGVDRTTGTLRPMHNSRFVDLSLNTGASTGYQKTGDLITLPYTEEAYVNIDKASETEFVNPYDIILFNGTVTLSPSKDLWFSTNRLPSVRRTVEGDYDTVLKGIGNALGTVWNNWQTDWLGEPTTTAEGFEFDTNRTITPATPRRAVRVVTPTARGRAFATNNTWSLKNLRRFERAEW